VKFVLIGSGPEKEKLLKQKETERLDHVYFLDAVSKREMPAILKSVNAAIIPLKKLDLFLGAIPSKIFENLAMEVPLLLGVDGEARELFIDKGRCGIYFEPGQASSLALGIEQLSGNPALAAELGKNGRKFVQEFFNRETIARHFHEQLLKL
jgi:glycosyltransferase involved in cell wall biosynthesis